MANQDIHERIYQFALLVVKLIRKTPRTSENQILTGQLLRSATSMGANDQEANGSFTKADFVHCYVLVRKEGKESLFWLRLLGDCNERLRDEYMGAYKEGNEIVSVITAIIQKTKRAS